MKYVLLLIIAAMLTACTPPVGSAFSSWQYMSDSKIRAERFDACMKALPAGPVSTQYNDWSEVVDSCEEAARKQSLTIAHYVNGVWITGDGKPIQ
jgi:hypothetical protein